VLAPAGVAVRIAPAAVIVGRLSNAPKAAIPSRRIDIGLCLDIFYFYSFCLGDGMFLQLVLPCKTFPFLAGSSVPKNLVQCHIP
jgi:hypothetical protein